MEQLSFGEELRRLMQKMPVSTLARGITVDKSAVYRWLRNIRTPSLNTDHVDHIATFLKLGLQDIERLKQAQVRSLSQTQRGSASRKRLSSDSNTAVNWFIEETYSRNGSSPLQRRSERPGILPRPLRPATLRGANSVLQAATELIAGAQPERSVDEPTILLSMQGEELFEGTPSSSGLEHGWREALQGALRRGWKIEHLLRLDKNIGRSLHIAQSMLGPIEIGGYHPRYFDRYGLLRTPYEMVIVPGHAAMLLLAIHNATRADGAIILTEPVQIDMMRAHYSQLRENTNPLLQRFLPQAQEMEFTLAMVNAESQPGGRMSAMDGLSGLTHPPLWISEDAIIGHNARRSGMVSEADIPHYLSVLQRRLTAFEAHVMRYDYLDICPLRAIRQLTNTGQLHPHLPLAIEFVPLRLRLEHIRRVIYLLQRYEHYRLALLDEHEELALNPRPAYIIAGNGDVFITTSSYATPETPINMQVHITEATIVAAFREHFLQMWERIAPPHRQKADVIMLLEQQAAILEQRIHDNSDE